MKYQKISIIIPAFNEESTILEILKKIKAVKLPIDKEIVIVDDFSTDKTRKILKNLNEKNIKVIFHDKNYGKGKAIRTALKNISGDIVIIQDADLEYDPQDYTRLIIPILNKKTKVVYGSRILGSKYNYSHLSFYLGGVFLSKLANFLYWLNITDEATCYKVFDAQFLKSFNLKCNRFEFCPEVTAKTAKKGEKIVEIPISYFPRSGNEGKKIKWKDGVEAIWTLIKYRFVN